MELLQFQRNVGHVAATAGHRFGFFRRHAIPMAVAAFGVGLWCMKKNADLSKRNAQLAERASRPSKIDWVEAGAVSRVVRNQKSCGSCWAMAVAASVEAIHYLKTLQSIALSVQELVDCNTENDGCNGGHYLYAFRYVRKNGLLAESSYPYIARKSICRKLGKKAAARISGFQFIRPTEDDLEKAVAKRPVIVTVQGHHLQRFIRKLKTSLSFCGSNQLAMKQDNNPVVTLKLITHKYDSGEAKMKTKSNKQQKISKINSTQIQPTSVLC
ncbi:hypothetical protein D1007_11983 [Hordeum vulgare]|nr:hypothetical protein D1007_11983 [Hordeum vulgare]